MTPSDRELRLRAEERLRLRRGERLGTEGSQDARRLIHDLEVHQIELEMQNEELRLVRDELEATSARYSELFDLAPVGYATLDKRSTIFEINLAGAIMLGKDRGRLVGQSFGAWVTLSTRPALEKLLAELQHEKRASCELAIITEGKEPVFVHVDAVPELPDDSKEWRCRAVLTDVTEHKAVTELRESDRRKSEFLSVLSHELRNPLAPISNAVRMLDHALPGSEQELRARAVIKRQTTHLTRLVDDLLDLTRISKGKVELIFEQVDLIETTRRTVDDYRPMFEQRGVSLRFTHPVGPVFVRGDATRLAQVIGNLLHNAAKFTPAGGAANIIVSAVLSRAEIRLRDSGIGIEPSELSRLFEPFAQVDHGLARSRGGLGLGLSLLKELVRLHDGSVTGSSEGLGCGSEFTVSLPLSLPPSVKAPAVIPTPSPRSIVLIEDNVDAATTLADLLTLSGHQVEFALTGRAGVDLVRKVRPDFVFCDIGLPDLSGFEVASILRTDETLRKTRLVALTGYAQPEDRAHAIEAGFDDHLAKPPDLAAMDALLAHKA